MRNVHIDLESGIVRIFRFILLFGKSHAIVGIGGIGDLGISRDLGFRLTIRTTGGTDAVTQWCKIEISRASTANGKPGRFRITRTTLRLPAWKSHDSRNR